MSTIERMRERLATLAPQTIEILDDSAMHAGHEGARSGGGHYTLTLVSGRFTGKTTVARHRMVYEAVGDLMRKEIHALTIHALAPDETLTPHQRKDTDAS